MSQNDENEKGSIQLSTVSTTGKMASVQLTLDDDDDETNEQTPFIVQTSPTHVQQSASSSSIASTEERNRQRSTTSGSTTEKIEEEEIKLDAALEGEQEQSFRKVYSNSNPEGKVLNLLTAYSSNAVKTTKYTWYNFLLMNVYQQFHRLANFFFLFVALLTLIPGITNISPLSCFIPLLFVLAVTAVKEAYDDVKRARSDTEINNRTCFVLRNDNFVEICWKDIQVGDIVQDYVTYKQPIWMVKQI